MGRGKDFVLLGLKIIKVNIKHVCIMKVRCVTIEFSFHFVLSLPLF